MSLRKKIGDIIFESHSGGAKVFDVLLLLLIILSILVVMLESVDSYASQYAELFWVLEWVLTGLFTVEYVLRLYTAYNPKKYALSFYGIVDLLAILPTYLSLVIPNVHYFIVIRSLRLLRMFRVLKMARYVGEADTLMRALRASRAKIIVFLYTVLTMVIVLGTLMYLIESKEAGFSNIPISIYWTVVTLTTVGYGDITPESPLGRFIAGFIMILGYGIIAVPTGIVTAELTRESFGSSLCKICPGLKHRKEASHCYKCGERLE